MRAFAVSAPALIADHRAQCGALGHARLSLRRPRHPTASDPRRIAPSRSPSPPAHHRLSIIAASRTRYESQHDWHRPWMHSPEPNPHVLPPPAPRTFTPLALHHPPAPSDGVPVNRPSLTSLRSWLRRESVRLRRLSRPAKRKDSSGSIDKICQPMLRNHNRQARRTLAN